MKKELIKYEFLPAKYCKATSSYLEIKEDTPYEIWEKIGGNLKKIGGAVQLWLGDWLNFGSSGIYGEKYSQALEESYYELSTLQGFSSIAGRTEKVRKLGTYPSLLMGHWDLIADLEEKDQEEWVKKTAKNNLTVKELREAIGKSKKLPTPDLPKGKYQVIYADPPWKYNDECKDGAIQTGGATRHYPVMTIEELNNLKIPSSDNAVLFLWVTSPLLEECFKVINSWGFQYKASFVWDKIKHNMGHYNSVRHEFLLICTKGNFVPEHPKLYDSVITEEKTKKHSEKPEIVYEIIETLYPNVKYLELFARNKKEGWDSWGIEV